MSLVAVRYRVLLKGCKKNLHYMEGGPVFFYNSYRKAWLQYCLFVNDFLLTDCKEMENDGLKAL